MVTNDIINTFENARFTGFILVQVEYTGCLLVNIQYNDRRTSGDGGVGRGIGGQ